MERELTNKVVVITGGASGIGYQISDKFLQNGIKTLIILDFNETEGVKTVNNFNKKYGKDKAMIIKCDVTKDLEDVCKKLDDYKVDVLVNNAGVSNESSLRQTIEINTIAVLELSMKFWHKMRRDKGGKGGTIINIGSIYSYLVNPYAFFYKASKHAVMGFTRSLGHKQNYDNFGVRAFIICPGFTVTNMNKKSIRLEEHEKDYKEYAKTMIWQQPEAVGEAAVELFKNADSGTAWNVVGGKITEIPFVEVSNFDNNQVNQ